MTYVVLQCTMLYHNVRCIAMHYVVSWRTLYCNALCCIMTYVVLQCTMLHHNVRCITMHYVVSWRTLYRNALCCVMTYAVLQCTMLYHNVRCIAMHYVVTSWFQPYQTLSWSRHHLSGNCCHTLKAPAFMKICKVSRVCVCVCACACVCVCECVCVTRACVWHKKCVAELL